jgi:hypothetical protein
METMLTMLKTDLGILTTTAYDARLTQLLTAAEKYIINEGASTLDASNIEDAQLIVMYAAWLWRKRDGTLGTRQSIDMTAMPRMLRLALNNRVFHEKAGGDPQ